MKDAIVVNNLRKEFRVYSSRPGLAGAFRDLLNRQSKIVPAVKDISFTVKQGEMVGYIGENGAGKSTTIKMLTGILSPTSGTVRVNDMDPHKEREKFVKTIGVVFGQRSQLWWDIAVQESFRLLKKVYNVPDDLYEDHMELIIRTLDIEPLLDKPVRKLSLGQRMRCELAAALIHNPKLLFLDEPTIGLDVLVKVKIRQFLKEINERYNTTILLTTHDLSDIEALCERVVMLDEGQIIYDGSLLQLKQNWGDQKIIHMKFLDDIPVEVLQMHTDSVATEKWIYDNKEHRYSIVLGADDEVISQLIKHVVEAFPIKDIHIEETSTEDIIQKIYEKGSAENDSKAAKAIG